MASSINASTSGAGGVITTADNTGILNLQTASTNAVTIDASQNVGIGTTSPTYKFQASNTNGDTQVGVYDLSSSSSAARLDIRTSGTGASQWFIQTGNTTSGLNGALRFYDQSITTERMRIDSSGVVWVGSSGGTFPYNATSGNYTAINATYPISVTNSNILAIFNRNTSTGTIIEFKYNGSFVATISTTGSAVAYNTTSDYRLKENIVPMTGALDKVAQLKPSNWTWKSTGENGQGFIAHELQAIVPDCVTGEKDDVDEDGNPKYQGVDTSFLVATLTAAIQEQQIIINDLKARVTALEAK